MDIEVVCDPDEANKFVDTLHFVIREGMDVDVQLKAKGEGPGARGLVEPRRPVDL